MTSRPVSQENLVTQITIPLRIVYMGAEFRTSIINQLPAHFNIDQQNSLQELFRYLESQSIVTFPDVLLLETDPGGNCFPFVENLKQKPLWKELIIVMIANNENKDWKSRALKLKVHDYYTIPFPVEHLVERIGFLVKFKNFIIRST